MFEHDSYDDFIQTLKKDDQIYYITRYGKQTMSLVKKPKNDGDIYLMFGKESTGISKDILVKNKNRTIRIPSSKNVRSLNLSNCVAICAYKVLELTNFSNVEKLEPHKIGYLDK